MRLSVVIPTLNEAAVLPQTLGTVTAWCPGAEVLCVDGGSTDETRQAAHRGGARVISCEHGRGRQQQAGASVARGEVLWFLHADTRVEGPAAAQIEAALRSPSVVGGNFRLHFEGTSRGARFLSALYPHLAYLGLRYGDSGIFVRRDAYGRAGGFRPLPIFEDLDLLRRLRPQGRLRTLAGPLRTSSRRFDGRAFTPVFARWVAMQVLYWAGCDPRRLGRWYYPRPHEPNGAS